MLYRVIIQRPKAQIAVRAGKRARNAAGGTPRRRVAEADRLGAAKLPQLSTRTRARRPNPKKQQHQSSWRTRSPPDPPKPLPMPPRDVPTRRPTKRVPLLALNKAPTPRRASRRRRDAAAPPDRATNTIMHAGKDAASTAKALEKAFGSSDADGCWLLSLVASDSTAPWSMTYYGKVLDGLGSKKGPIKAAAKAAWAKVVPTLQPEAAPLEMKALYGAMGVEKQWPCRVAALERVAALCASAPKQAAACLPTLVPELTPSLWDTKKESRRAKAAGPRPSASGNRTRARHPQARARVQPQGGRGDGARAGRDDLVQSVDSPTLAVGSRSSRAPRRAGPEGDGPEAPGRPHHLQHVQKPMTRRRCYCRPSSCRASSSSPTR